MIAFVHPLVCALAHLQCRLSPTGTFKIQKIRLQKEGFDPRITADRIFFLNSRAGRYEAVTEEMYNALVEGRVPL